MRLVPYPEVPARQFKVRKHVFNPRERWYEQGPGLEVWTADWHRLRGFGLLDPATPVGSNAEAAAILDRWHTVWIEAAGRAVDQGRAAGRVEWNGDREQLVGDGGVFVVVAGSRRLVTCFKVVDEVHPNSMASERMAVRRLRRRASLLQQREE